MNSGKVRIYELSKELNLENRDILAVCEQLNISVKSHSSTITEDDAARIRSAAEKYVPARAPAKKIRTPNRSNPSSSKAPIKKKQQILEIRKRSDNGTESSGGELVAKPQMNRPTSQATPPTKMAQPPVTRPAPSKPSDTESSTLSPKLEPPTRPSAPAEAGSDGSGSDGVLAQVGPSEVPSPSENVPPSEAAVSPKLISPPARPVANKPTAARGNEQRDRPVSRGDGRNDGAEPDGERKVAAKNRPVLKRSSDKGEGRSPSQPKRQGSSPPQKVGKAVAGPSSDQERSRNRGSGPDGEKRSTAKTATVDTPRPAELKRPVNRPAKPSKGEGILDDASLDEDNLDLLDTDTDKDIVGESFDLRRPTLPRLKREKPKNDEDEDDDTVSPKKGAKAVKGKRRTQPVVLEDDDFEDDGDDLDGDEVTPQQVSLSLMRPPKPKSMGGASAKPVAARKKSPPRSGANRGQRRDRRPREVEQERPELLELSDSIAVHDLATKLVVPETDIIKSLFFKGIAANINQILDIPTATMVAEEFGVLVEAVEADAEAKKVTEMLEESDLENLEQRPPVVTIMGHVDHGKTTLLDSIRKAKVAQGEAGGITQHIGAYHVDVQHGDTTQQVVFLDTPGHEAFTAMRARGARVTDIAVLVVAADDGVRPQTIEAIKHAQAAEVPIVVAINKVDKEEAQPDRVKQELTEHNLVPEEWGGETIMVPVSALNGYNLDALLEMILLVSEVEDLNANPNRPARGTVIEANLDKARGPVATLLIQNGTLRVGDCLVAGSVFGKVRAMIDDQGKRVKEATPSFAAEVLGLSDVPAAGDEFEVFIDEKEARSVANSRSDEQRLSRLQQAMASRRVSLNTISAQAQEGDLKELNLILKADVQGSVEAILASLQQLPQKEVQVRVLLAAPGEISETDVDLAAASGAVIIGFNTTLASGARQAADNADVDIRDYDIIYKLLEDIEGAMEGLLDPELVEEPLGQAEVRAVFPVGRGAVAGCYIQSGKIVRNCNIRVLRSGEVVFTGNLDSLKRMKEDAKEVNSGFECGVGIDNFNSWQERDIIEAYRMATRRRTLTG
ncbi:MAG: translation initiation factor IF-2 [Leptolyngbyaceae bacterium]|nr:translation initiation factor IF-2 [Leptolyngbyaceae bacterium]